MHNEALSEKESLQLISQMIEKAKNSHHDKGIGPILWGSIITLCSLATYLQIEFKFDFPFDIWLLSFFAIIPQIYFGIKEKRARKVKTYDETMMDYLWSAFGVALFLLILIINHVHSGLRPTMVEYKELTGHAAAFRFNDYTTSFFLLLYGIPTIVTGGARKFKPMLWGGSICWVCCVISVYTPIKIDMLLSAVAATSAWLIPGILLSRKYKRNHPQDV